MSQSISDSMVSSYTLGATDAELRRLIDLASHEEDRVVDACRRAGIGEGATVLDLGCGPLGALGAWLESSAAERSSESTRVRMH